MDGLKELVDAFSSRVRSPVFGSIAIAFLLWNWQAVFLLLFGEGDAPARIAAFTDSLWVWKYAVPINFAVPVLLGLFYLFVSPWLNLGAAMLVAKPTNKRRDLVDQWAVERAQKKAVLAAGLADAATEEAEAEKRKIVAEAEVEAEKRREELAVREAEIEQQAADAQLAAQKLEADIVSREKELDLNRLRERKVLEQTRKELETKHFENEELRVRLEKYTDEVGTTNSTVKPLSVAKNKIELTREIKGRAKTLVVKLAMAVSEDYPGYKLVPSNEATSVVKDGLIDLSRPYYQSAHNSLVKLGVVEEGLTASEEYHLSDKGQLVAELLLSESLNEAKSKKQKATLFGTFEPGDF